MNQSRTQDEIQRDLKQLYKHVKDQEYELAVTEVENCQNKWDIVPGKKNFPPAYKRYLLAIICECCFELDKEDVQAVAEEALEGLPDENNWLPHDKKVIEYLRAALQNQRTELPEPVWEFDTADDANDSSRDAEIQNYGMKVTGLFGLGMFRM